MEQFFMSRGTERMLLMGERPSRSASRGTRSAIVAMGGFCREVCEAAASRSGRSLDDAGADAVRRYLSDRATRPSGWACPGFLPEGDDEDAAEVRIELDAESWDLLAREADRQRVAVEQLVRHAILYASARGPLS